MGIGHIWILGVLVVIALLVFGPARLPDIGRNVGRALSEFKKALEGNHDHDAE